MNQQYYKYLRDEDCLWFEFESISQNKTIRKVLVFSPLENDSNIFNLALADAFPDGSFSDLAVSNNDDLEKVMATVIRTMLCFFEKHPDKMVYIEGSSKERTRLYRIIISRELSDIEKTFDVYGLRESHLELFKKNHNYEAFVVTLNNKENLLKLLYENEKR